MSDEKNEDAEAFRRRSAARREIMRARLFRRSSGESEGAFDRRFWAEAGLEAVWSASWEMTLEAMRFRGEDTADQPQLQRDVSRLLRRGR